MASVRSGLFVAWGDGLQAGDSHQWFLDIAPGRVGTDIRRSVVAFTAYPAPDPIIDELEAPERRVEVTRVFWLRKGGPTGEEGNYQLNVVVTNVGEHATPYFVDYSEISSTGVFSL